VSAAVEQDALGARFDNDVGNQAGKFDVVGADGQQHEIESAILAMLARDGQRVVEARHLRARRRRARRIGAGVRAFRDDLRAEEAGCDGCA
jgi:hypothetical protein